jgi:outer membrane lipoprotein carrier protein
MSSPCRGAASRLAALALCVVCAGAPSSASAQSQGADARSAPESAPDAAAEACRKRAIDAVQRRYEGIRDLRARFVQTSSGASVGARAPVQTTSRGSVVVAKPSRMRWTYEAPDASVVVSDGKTLWIYDPGFGEVQRMPVGDGFLSGAALEFLLGRGDMERDFEVRLVSCAADAVELELTPREPASWETLRLQADPRNGNVSRTQIRDLLGNVAILEFSEVAVNLDPGADVFRFEAPDGVRVIDVSPAP